MTLEKPNKTHEERMARKKAVMDERIANAKEERGVLILLKGNGKGKSSSALGTMARCVGHGKPAAVVQFIKGRRETGEFKFFSSHPLIEWHVMGEGFTWETQSRERDEAAAAHAWEITERLLQDPNRDIVVLDEMAYMFKYRYLPLEPVIAALKARPRHQHVIITGRVMPEALEEIADTISDIKDQRHAFRLGVTSQAGIEY